MKIYTTNAIKDHFEVAQCPLWHCKLMSISVAMGCKRRKLQCYEACTQGKKVATKDVMKEKIKWLFKHDGEGESILSPPKIVVTRIIFMQLIFLIMYGHHIWDYFCFLKLHLIRFRFHLINYIEKFNKHWRIWTYGVYSWQINICHNVWNFEYIFENQGCGWNSWVNFY